MGPIEQRWASWRLWRGRSWEGVRRGCWLLLAVDWAGAWGPGRAGGRWRGRRGFDL